MADRTPAATIKTAQKTGQGSTIILIRLTATWIAIESVCAQEFESVQSVPLHPNHPNHVVC